MIYPYFNTNGYISQQNLCFKIFNVNYLYFYFVLFYDNILVDFRFYGKENCTVKKFIGIFLSCLISLSPCMADADYIYTIEKSQKINNAITYEEKQLLTDFGWIRAYVAYVDLSNTNTDIKVLTSKKGVSYLDTVKNMAKNEPATLA